MRLATWNLLHGVSTTDGTVSEAALRSAVTALDADVLGLQEVDSEQPRSHGLREAAVAADALGAVDWRWLPTLVGTPGRHRTWRPTVLGEVVQGSPAYGIALLSRLPVLRWAELRLAAAPFGAPLVVPGDPRPRVVVVPDEPRAALAAVVETADGPVSVVTAHLSFVPGFNVRQLRQVVRWARAELPAPRVLLGDLNLPGGLPGRVSGWQQVGRVPTYPSARPRLAFDAVLGDGLSGWSASEPRAVPLPVSDHAALVLELSSASSSARPGSGSGRSTTPLAT
ncbi:endonuclease/exonuclease/phosphatase family protein [Motilibacter peucedani]|uniref:endonuclease/exonuclease/phosphatase family protein n=1 Tax=Motilibacter peucedani TaxID=598650 RepID=UPI0038B32D20